MTQKPQTQSGKVPSFFLSLETNDLIIHNCMVDCGDTHNIMPLSVMKTMVLDCTKHYQYDKSIYTVDSRSVSVYGEIKEFYARKFFPIHSYSFHNHRG